MRRRTGAVPVEGQWPLRRELQMREEADSESDLRPPQVPHRDDRCGAGAEADSEAATECKCAASCGPGASLSDQAAAQAAPAVQVASAHWQRHAQGKSAPVGPSLRAPHRDWQWDKFCAHFECMSQNRSWDTGVRQFRMS
jgi:hypothetical protein